jgi:dipeptidyl aminopeptidase/acylaminoacyl peptidase
MLTRQIVRIGSLRAVAVAIALLPLMAHAASLETRTLGPQLARNAALPAAAAIKDEDFSRRSRLAQVKLSPDGAWLAFLESDGKAQALYLLDTRTGDKKKLLAISGRQDPSWSSDSKVIFLDSGDGLSQVSIADGASSKLAAFDEKKEQQFLFVDPSQPRHGINEEFDRAAGVYRISRIGVDGVSQVIYEGGKKVDQFLLDGAGQVSFIRTKEADFTQVVSRKQDGKWIEATRCKRLRPCELVAASNDQRSLTMVVNHADDRKALVQLDLASKATRVVHTDPLALADLKQAVLAPGSRAPLFAVYDAPARRNYGLTPAARQGGADIAKRFPDANITISASAPRWLLTEKSARLNQDRYWMYDVATRRIAPVLAQESAQGQPLAENQLAQKIALHYRGSDGALLHGYVSLPPGKDAAKLPMVTMVHGGPWGKFDNDYSALVQLLVNRGYAVFQPNFRASTGYGDKYMTAPKSDFGNGRVQADIIDGVRWLVAKGVGDKDRLAIMGDSFGGYSTLLALSHTPDLFKFGMAMVPPPDFGRTMKAAAAGPAYGDDAPFSVTLTEMGIDLNDAAVLKALSDSSPAAQVGKVSKPLLILAGGKDRMVDPASVTDYVARLQGMNKPVTLLLDPDEGHQPRKPLLRQAYTHLLLRGLHQHLGGPAPAAPSPELAKYLEQNLKVNTALN